MSFRNIQVVVSGNTTPLQASLRSASAQLDQFAHSTNRNMMGLASTTGIVQKGIAAGVVVIAASVVASAAAAASFDRDMRNVNSISKMTEDQYKSLSTTVINMSKTSTQSATTLAKGLYDVASSGFQGAAGIKILDAAQRAASAGLSDTATAAKAITATLNAYGLEASSAADVSDVLFQTVNLGVVSFDELASQLGDVVGIAAAAKIPIDDVGSAIAAMTLSGISAAESTTSLNRVIQSILQPSDALVATFKSMGYESGSQALAADGLYGVMEKLRVATGGTADAYLKLFPDIRSARGAFALAANEGQNYAKSQASISDETARAGATQAAYKEQMKSVTAQIAIAKNQLAAFAIEAGTHLLPTVAALVHGAVGLGGAFGHDLRQGAELIAPLFHEMVAVGRDWVKIAMDITSVLGPLVGALIAITATGVVEALTAMERIERSILDPIAAHKSLALGLAAGLVVLLVPLTAVTFMFNKWILTPIVLALDAIIGAVGSATVALSEMAVAEAAATLGISAIVALGVGLGVYFWGNAKKAEEQAKKTAAAIASIYDPKVANGSLEKLTQQAGLAVIELKHVEDSVIRSLGEKGVNPDLLGDPEYLRMVSNEYKAADDQINRINSDLGKIQSAATEVGAAMGLSATQVVKLASKYGVDLHDGVDKAYDALQSAVGTSLSGTAAFNNLAEATDTLSAGVASADEKLQALKDTFDSIIGVNLSADEALDKYRSSLDDLAQSFAENGGAFDAFTAKGRANKQALRDSIAAINDHIAALQAQGATGPTLKAAFDAEYAGLVNTMKASGMTDKAIRNLLSSYGLIPNKLETAIAQSGATEATQQVMGLVNAINQLHNRQIMIQTITAQVDAGTISPQMAANMRRDSDVWNAPPPVSAPKISTGQVKSPSLAGAATGVSRTGSATQSSGYTSGSGSTKKTAAQIAADKAKAAADARQRAQDAQDARDAAAERRRQQARDTRLAPAGHIFDPGQIYSDLVTRRTNQAQAIAQARADNSKNKSDTAADYFKAPVVTLKDYQKELTKQVAGQRQWKKDLARIAKEAGQDVADQLEAMGESGVDLVSKMAKGTKSQVDAMAKTLRSLAPTAKQAMQDFADALHLDVAKQAAFQKNLTALISSGHADLAGVLAAGGVDQYGDVAKAALTATPAQLVQITKDLLTQNSQATGQDLTDLIEMITKITSSTGVLGLSKLTGLAASRELDLYSRYTSLFESGAAGRLARWKGDLALINSGQQPSGYAAGGIIPHSQTGEFYRWAEPESGGESLIPHGQAHRGRALALWAQTGRILGVGGPVKGSSGALGGSPGGSGTSISIATGAVRVEVTVPNTSASPAQIRDAVESGVKDAMGKLTTLVRVGTGRNT